jgi:DNA-binding HxlR family transcriptional regulator
VEYSLTDLGLELVPAINAIADVGHKLKERKKTRTPPLGKAKQRVAAE